MATLIFGIMLGAVLGATSMWLYLMNKYAARPIDWRQMVLTAALTFAVLGALLGSRTFQ